jgi:hypothetical protein
MCVRLPLLVVCVVSRFGLVQLLEVESVTRVPMLVTEEERKLSVGGIRRALLALSLTCVDARVAAIIGAHKAGAGASAGAGVARGVGAETGAGYALEDSNRVAHFHTPSSATTMKLVTALEPFTLAGADRRRGADMDTRLVVTARLSIALCRVTAADGAVGEDKVGDRPCLRGDMPLGYCMLHGSVDPRPSL